MHTDHPQGTSPTVIFVAGVHGVGKSTFSKALSEATGIPSFSAGKLIADRRKNTPPPDRHVADVPKNQDALVEAICRLPGNPTTIILDGHFCVRDATGGIKRIPFATYQALRVKLAMVLCSDVRTIQNQLQQRDGMAPPIEELEAFQRAEIEYGEKVASDLGIPFSSLNASEIDNARLFLMSHVEFGKACG